MAAPNATETTRWTVTKTKTKTKTAAAMAKRCDETDHNDDGCNNSSTGDAHADEDDDDDDSCNNSGSG
jgi:hypothetical protein